MFAKRFLCVSAGLICVSLLVAMSCPTPARAWTEFLSMDVLPEQVGWTHVSDGLLETSSVVKDGVLTLSSGMYSEYWAPPNWLGTVSNATGYTIEFRMRLLTGVSHYPDAEIGVWYYDNTSLTKVGLAPGQQGLTAGRVYISYPTAGLPYALLDVSLWHTYTIVVQGTHQQVFVDGVLTLDWQHPGTGDGSHILSFGDLGLIGYTQSEWDYVAYDTQAVVPVAPTTWGRLKTLYRAER